MKIFNANRQQLSLILLADKLWTSKLSFVISKKPALSRLLNFNFSFDLDLEFDTKDEMSNLKKKVKTEEEINMCAVSEEFDPCLKALHILKKGYEV